MQPSFFVVEFFVIAIIFLGSFLMFLKREIAERRELAERKRQRLAYVQQYCFPAPIFDTLAKQYPHLSQDQIGRVENGLRTYFMLILREGFHLAMPSRAVDTLWHEFILFTQDYHTFCQDAFGQILHHVPFPAMQSPEQAQQATRNAWLHSCKAEGINPLLPQRLPLLFALDAELGITDGFIYSAERGIYPRLDITVSPRVLRSEIRICYRNAKTPADKQAAIERLAPVVKKHVLSDAYCKVQGVTALTPLFDALLEFEGLAVAVFGDMAEARKRQQEVKKYPDPVAGDGDGGGGGGDGGGGGGSCGGCGGC